MLAVGKDTVDGYWRHLRACVDRGLERVDVEERAIAIAGWRVRLRFANPALVPIVMPALGHLTLPSAQAPDLTVLIADGASASVPPISWPVMPEQGWLLQTNRFSALHLPELGSVLWFDRVERLALYWMPDATCAPLVERGSPLLTLWAWWLADHGLQLTHGAAIGGRRGAGLIVARSGSGKSTTALACVGGPLRYLGDDYCVVEPGATPIVHSLYCSGKIDVSGRVQFEPLRRYRTGEGDGKTLYNFDSPDMDLLALERPLVAMLVPVVTGRPSTQLVPISAMAAVLAAAPSTVLQLRTGTAPADALKRLADVARRVPCYRLELGSDIGRIRQVLAELLD